MDPNTSTTPQQPQKSNMMMIVIGIVVLVLIGVGVMFAMNRNTASQPEQAVQDTSTVQPTAAMETSEQTTEPTGAMTEEAMEEGEVKEFTVSGRNFSFSPSVIRVNEGDTVRVIFENTGGTHDFTIDEFDVATAQIQGGQSETVTFVADQAGTFDFYCSVGQHRANGMEGQLIVE